MKKILINLGKGILLVAGLWLINTFIAFAIFDPIDEHTKIINISWLIADITIIVFLMKSRKVIIFS